LLIRQALHLVKCVRQEGSGSIQGKHEDPLMIMEGSVDW